MVSTLDFSIIIPCWNSRKDLSRCLPGLARLTAPPSFEIIIVDNDSSDGTVEWVRGQYPQVVVLPSGRNGGFAFASNIGLRAAKGRWLLLLNPDTEVRQETLEGLARCLETHIGAGIVGGKVLNPDGTLQAPCRRRFPDPAAAILKFTGLSTLFPRSGNLARYELTALSENKTQEVDAVSGSCMAIRRETWEQVGDFDESFFIYGEDLDYCYRAKEKNWKVIYCAEAPLVHYRGASRALRPVRSLVHAHQAMALYYRKHLAKEHNPVFNGMIYAGIALRCGVLAVVSLLFRK